MGIKYSDLNDELSKDELAEFVTLLARLVRWSEGAVSGTLVYANETTGETMRIHIDAHDAVVCEMHKLAQLDKTVGSEIQ